jgi:superfamily II DNA or RNA helicase
MKTRIQFPAIWGINENWNGNTIQRVIVPGSSVNCSVTEYANVFFQGQKRHQIKGYIIKPEDGANGNVFAITSGNQAPDEFDYVLRVQASKFGVPADFVDYSKATWIRHPSLSKIPVAPIDFKKQLEEVINSWNGAFSFLEEDPSKQIKGLRPPQIGAIHAIHAHWTTNSDPATIVMPTGTGKTETMLSILLAKRCSKALVIVPTDALRTQIANKFLTLGVLKDCEVASGECLYPVVGILRHRPKSCEEVDYFFERCNVVVTTIHVAGQCIPEAQERMAHHCPFLFIDEAHHIAAHTWSEFRKFFASRKILQFTATPYREDNKPVEGRIIFKYPLAKAQREDYFRKINFIRIREFDPRKADKVLAAQAVAQLREDRKNYNHVLMARVDTIENAEKVFSIYEEYAEFNPVRIHRDMKTREREKIRKKIINGESQIVVCVNMLGEGFDLPELKIAAFHHIRKSLAATIQLAGRFTRSRADLGEATVIANVAEVNVREELAKLYRRDPDWNVLLPGISEDAIQGQIDLMELVEGFKNLPQIIPLHNLRPALSTVIYKTKCQHWTPENFRKGIPGIASFEKVLDDINHEKDTLIIVTARKVPVVWAQIENMFDWVWELYILFWDRERNLLFINTSGNEGQYKRLAETVAGDIELIEGEDVFRSFYGVNRLRLQNVGLSEHLGQLVTYTGRMGPDVEPALTKVIKHKASKSVIFGTGFEYGRKTTVGCSAKGRIWAQQRTSNLDALIKWCKSVGEKILDESIDPNEVLGNTLIPVSISERYKKMPIGIAWPEHIYKNSETIFTFVDDNNQEYPLFNTDINLVNPTEEGDITFGIRSGDFSAEFVQTVFEKNKVKKYSFALASNRPVWLKHGSNVSKVEEFFHEHPPTIWFADGASLKGNRLTILKGKFDPYPKEKIQTWEWKRVNFRKESQGITKEIDSIQYRVIEKLKKRSYQIIFDDDDSGEAADIVTINVEERSNKEKCICVEFYHCKFSLGDTPGGRIKDLYELCGQAQKSIHWMEDPFKLFAHLLRREPRKEKGQEISRFERGDADDLFEIMEMSRVYAVELKIFIVQPGLSKLKATPSQLELLSVTENHLMGTYQIPFTVIGSP